MSTRAIRSRLLPALGQPFAGGFFAGRYYLHGEERALVLADQSHDLLAQLWDRTGPRPLVRGAQDYMDGLANTEALAEAGSTVAEKVLRLRIGGFDGWHIPARDQLVAIQIGLLPLPTFGREGDQSMSRLGCNYAGHVQYWSSTMKRAGSAWYLHMLPWCCPETNWATKSMGVRPVRSIPILPEPDAMDLPAECAIVGPTPMQHQHFAQRLDEVAAVLEQFINEDSGRFYGRTEDLLAQLSSIGREARR